MAVLTPSSDVFTNCSRNFYLRDYLLYFAAPDHRLNVLDLTAVLSQPTTEHRPSLLEESLSVVGFTIENDLLAAVSITGHVKIIELVSNKTILDRQLSLGTSTCATHIAQGHYGYILAGDRSDEHLNSIFLLDKLGNIRDQLEFDRKNVKLASTYP